MNSKKRLRKIWKRKRGQISDKRKKIASSEAISALLEKINQHKYVLSYASFGDEFRTQELNNKLCEKGKLLLPKVDGGNLRLFHVEGPIKQLRRHPWGFWEPIPSLCHEVNESMVSLAFVPGIAFDADCHRLGYGKGCYDRFLSKLPKQAKAYGLGFKEQYSPTLLPTIPSDRPLHGLLLF